jgi:hypothetical protein
MMSIREESEKAIKNDDDCFRLLHAVTIPCSAGTGLRKQMEQQWMEVSVTYKIIHSNILGL